MEIISQPRLYNGPNLKEIKKKKKLTELHYMALNPEKYNNVIDSMKEDIKKNNYSLEYLNQQDINGNSILSLMIDIGLDKNIDYSEIIDLLISCGVDIDLYDYNEGYNPLTYAVYYNNIDIVKKLISNGCNINHKIKKGLNSLYIATYRSIRTNDDRSEMVNLLIKHGCDINVIYDGYSLIENCYGFFQQKLVEIPTYRYGVVAVSDPQYKYRSLALDDIDLVDYIKNLKKYNIIYYNYMKSLYIAHIEQNI